MTSYLVEAIQQQRVMVRIDAHSPAEAVDRVNDQQGQLEGDQQLVEVIPQWTRIISGE
jgi:hypothetical protein